MLSIFQINLNGQLSSQCPMVHLRTSIHNGIRLSAKVPYDQLPPNTGIVCFLGIKGNATFGCTEVWINNVRECICRKACTWYDMCALESGTNNIFSCLGFIWLAWGKSCNAERKLVQGDFHSCSSTSCTLARAVCSCQSRLSAKWCFFHWKDVLNLVQLHFVIWVT